jgi:hypothetical protein
LGESHGAVTYSRPWAGGGGMVPQERKRTMDQLLENIMKILISDITEEIEQETKTQNEHEVQADARSQNKTA